MWEQIRSNQVKSVILVVMMAAVLLALGYFLGVIFLGSATAGLAIAVVLWLIMSLLGYFQGSSIILGISGAAEIGPNDHPRLYNVVEEMKIASGLPKMPEVYIIDDPALNAFATGRDENHAAVAITSGLLEKLNRDELQGVIAHEISHVKNRDVMLMSLLSIMLGTIVILAWYASRALFFSGAASRGSRRSGSGGGGGGAQIIILAVGIILMILAPILAQLIYFATSRKREYLADASGALYTRYPEGLASALEKLANSDTHVKTANKATAPMYTVNPFQKKGELSNLTSTHPPLADRIRILRAMGGASYTDYERAYKQVRGQSILPTFGQQPATAVPLRAASAAPALGTEGGERLDRARETSDVLWRQSNYRTIDCDCGTRLRIPASLHQPTVQCPHCGRVHRLD